MLDQPPLSLRSRQSCTAVASTSDCCTLVSSAHQQGRRQFPHSSSSSSGGGRQLCSAAAAAGLDGSSAPPSATASFASLDKREAAKFAALADEWWSPTGPFAPLLALNPARCAFIRQAATAAPPSPHGTATPVAASAPAAGQEAAAEPLAGLSAVDVGCGGGLLSEPLARLGAQVGVPLA